MLVIISIPIHRVLTLLGLFLIALGSGGIKPCVAAFGGDQFKLPEQVKQVAMFFSVFYFSINSGSLVSTAVTPILRQDVRCFGDDDCYSVAFGVPGLLMVISIFIFISGKWLYKIVAPSGNMVVLVFRCICNAIATRWRERSSGAPKKSHWMEYAEAAYGRQLVHDTRVLLNVLVLYLPLPLFWSLFDQQGSRWTFQATRMDGDLGFYEIKPDQMQVINPLLILLFIPLYEMILYPLLSKIGIRRPLQKLTLGGILAGIAFICSAVVELELEKTYPVLPSTGLSQLRMYNTRPDCLYLVETNIPFEDETSASGLLRFELPGDGLFQKELNVHGNYTYKMTADKCPTYEGQIELIDAVAYSYFISGNGLTAFEDDPAKSSSGIPVLRVLANLANSATSRVEISDHNEDGHEAQVRYSELANVHTRIELPAGKYQVEIDGKHAGVIHLRLGAVAALMLTDATTNGGGSAVRAALAFVSEANSMPMLWLVPQYVIMTFGEVMFSVTGLAFSYAQAPISMKSVLQSCWLLTVAFGNVIDVIIVGASIFESQVSGVAVE